MKSENKTVVRADAVQQSAVCSQSQGARGGLNSGIFLGTDYGQVRQSAVCAIASCCAEHKGLLTAQPLLDQRKGCPGSKPLLLLVQWLLLVMRCFVAQPGY
jgi:hypothetical protein